MKGRENMNGNEFPMMLTANDLQAMGFRRAMVYKILNSADVPVVKIGNRKFIQRDKFFKWLDSKEVQTDAET
jgi:hypothetical protein